jgi:Holliday junction DNA helicase RuvA
MIETIKGRVARKEPTLAVIEVGGVAFAVNVPLGVSERLGGVGSEATLTTYLHVREDNLQLFGFNDREERDLFIRLLTISGVGPKLALGILSRFSPTDLARVVMEGDSRRLTAVRGIGRKTAERLLLEFRGKVDIAPVRGAGEASGQEWSAAQKAIKGLESLGYSLQDADEAVRKAIKLIPGEPTVEEIIKAALKG